MATDVNPSSHEKSRFWEFFKRNHDEVKVPENVESNNKWLNEAGMERLRKMYSLDEYGHQSKEMLLISQSVSMSCFGGGILGAVIQSREAFVSFMENNQATKFANHMDAKRSLQRKMFLAIVKGGFHWGWQVGLFSATFTTLMTTVSVYRGYESVTEYVVAGGLTGGLYKINMGIKGLIAGCFLGSILGLVGGSLSTLALKTGGVSMNDMRNFSKMIVENRDSTFQKSCQEQLVKEHTDLAYRDIGVGKGLDELKLDAEPK